jgi:hypothetical protein
MEQSRTHPLSVFAFVAAFSLLQDIYHVAQTHEIVWLALLRTVMAVPFLAFYLMKSSYAWFALMAGFVPIYPVYFIVIYFTQPSHLPSVTVAMIMALIYLVGIVYVISVRPRYYSYLDSHVGASND